MLQLFILSLTTLAVSATGVLFVKPSNDTPCPQLPCHTLEHYAQSWQLFLTSNTIVQFLPGEHILEGDWNVLSVENISNLTLMGSDIMIFDSMQLGIPIAASRVTCRRSETRFLFSNITELFITRLTFSECGGGTPQLKFAFFLNDIFSLVLDSVTIQNSTGIGLIGYNLWKSSILHSAFMFNQALEVPLSGNMILYYGKCSVKTETNITSSWILFGNGTSVGGLSLQVDQSCYNVKIHIHNTTLRENVGHSMVLGLNGIAHSIITITESHIESGYSSEAGGGIYIYTTNNSPHTLQHFQNSRVYINNTKFVENYAKLGGGAMYVHSCTGTELHINDSKFHNNVAQTGGHIAISLLYTSRTCINTTITISNSLFENGEATGGGGGGGISVGGPRANNYRRSDGNHIHISNTRFVGNHAKIANGGAVSLWGVVGTEMHIDESEFNNNTTPFSGGHIALELLSDHVLFIIINNSHFESGTGDYGGGILVNATAGDSCTPVSNTTHKSVHIMNSKIYANIAGRGGGMAILFNQSCLAIDIVIHNISLSRNTATNLSGGNLYLSNICTAGNSVTISSSTVEFGNASGAGGGMIFLVNGSDECSSMQNLKPAIVSIVDSTFQYNTAYYMGGGFTILADSFQYICCSAEVYVTNVTFVKNKVSSVLVSRDGKGFPAGGGNIYIDDNSGQWLNSLVRIERCQIEGGVARSGGGIWVNHLVTAIFRQPSTEVKGVLITNTQFICNRATANNLGASLVAVSMLQDDFSTTLNSFSPTLNSFSPTITKKLTVINTTFDGSCSDSNNVIIEGFGIDTPYLQNRYSVLFINVSFRGYSTSPSQQFSASPQYDDFLFLLYLHNPTTLNQTQQGVLLYSIPNATFIDCEFFESSDSTLYASSTRLFLEGNITFRDNTATYGAGLALNDRSVMYLRPNTHIMFSHNHATYYGGAIYVQPVDTRDGNFRCFYQLDGVNQAISDPNIQITFENNTADFAGNVLYGGLVDFCVLVPINTTRNNSFDSIFKVQNTDEDPTAISSDPYKVCSCNDSKPQCGQRTYLSMHTYPGALFHVQAVVVGQKDGIVPGIVQATLQNTSATLGDLQRYQSTGKSCTTLNYTVFSSHSMEQIILVTEKNLLNLLNQPGLVINVALLNCPWGFSLTGFPTKCDCADELQKHHISCNITTQTISRPPPLWIGYYHSGSNAEQLVEGVLVHDQCPFDYCKPEQLSIQLNDSDKQCAFNHSGILCGACQPGLSLALGTSRCLKCSNKFLMLLFAFAAAGLALVFLLTLTNMTVSEGTINGLVFYANIIHINRAIFFPSESNGINKIILDILSTFISWINLDLGIETCFYNGLDMYTKAWLQFLFPIYIWTIVGGMIVSSHYSTTAAKLFRRHAVKVLATLFLLSFAKLQRTIITALSFTFLTYPDGTKTVWLYDSNVEYLHGKHIVLFIAAVLALLFFLIPYTLVLLLIQCLLKLNCRIFFWVAKLKPLFDAYTGPYKDRYQFWTGFLLVVRTVLFLIFTLGNPGLNLTAISATSTCLAFAPAVYKKVWLTLLEYFLLLNLGVTSVATFYCHYTQFSGNQAVVVYISVGTALITFIGILVYHLCQCTIKSRAWKAVSDRVTQMNNNRELVNIAVEGSDEEEEEEPAQAEIRPLVLQFDEYREPVLVYEDQN